MYSVFVWGMMLVLPLVSIALEGGGAPRVALVGRWFVFWGVGVRSLVAGLRQTLQPRFTAETIFGVKDPESFAIVRELGFANTAMVSDLFLATVLIVFCLTSVLS